MSDDAIPAPASLGPGDKVADYRLEEQIGQGGMAVVYRARDERLNRQVALKLLTPALTTDAAFRTRFVRESRVVAAVEHPNIVPVYDTGDFAGFLSIAMRYIRGGDVRVLFGDGQVIEPARAGDIVAQVAAALDAAHAHGLVHRDVKPANMLLDVSRRTDHVYLSDFGISRFPGLSGTVDPVLARAMAKSPGDRYPTCTDFADELSRALARLPGQSTVTAARPGPAPVPILSDAPPRPQKTPSLKVAHCQVPNCR